VLKAVVTDASIDLAVNYQILRDYSNPVRAELVEVYEHHKS